MKRKVPIFSIVLYALSGLLAAYTVWSVVYYMDAIKEAIELGQTQYVFSGNEFFVTNLYMGNISPYFIYSLVCFALGWIMHKYLRPSVPAPLADLEESDEPETESIMYDFNIESFGPSADEFIASPAEDDTADDADSDDDAKDEPDQE